MVIEIELGHFYSYCHFFPRSIILRSLLILSLTLINLFKYRKVAKCRKSQEVTSPLHKAMHLGSKLSLAQFGTTIFIINWPFIPGFKCGTIEIKLIQMFSMFWNPILSGFCIYKIFTLPNCQHLLCTVIDVIILHYLIDFRRYQE
jgi:hypothetical protein